MTDSSNRNDRPDADLWPVIDHRLGHIRTPLGTVIPFSVTRTVAALVIVLLAVEATFGLTNWITVPVFLLTIAWALYATEEASIRHTYRTTPDDLDGEQS